MERSNTGLKAVIVILLIALLASLSYIAYDKGMLDFILNKEEKKEVKVDKDIAKLDNSKPYIYEAKEYIEQRATLEYTSTYKSTPITLNDLIVPFININSTDADEANKEIKSLFDVNAIALEKESKTLKSSWISSSYMDFTNEKYLSVLMTTINGGSTGEKNKYNAYNLNLKDGKLLTYEDVYKKAGFTMTTIEEKVKDAISTYLTEKYPNPGIGKYTDEQGKVYELKTLIDYINLNLQLYKNDVMNNALVYYLDSSKQLNIVVKMYLKNTDKELSENLLIIK